MSDVIDPCLLGTDTGGGGVFMHALLPTTTVTTRVHTALAGIPPSSSSDQANEDWLAPWRLMSHEPHSIVFWELTPGRKPENGGHPFPSTISRSLDTLSTFESYKLIDQIVALSPDEVVFTGDGSRRRDLHELIRYARRRLLEPALVVDGDAPLTYQSIARLQQCGLTRLIFGIDGSPPKLHDRGRAIPGAFAATTRAMRWARTMSLAVEVNTLVARHNAADLSGIADLITQFSIDRWNAYFLVPAGNEASAEALTADEIETAFGRLFAISQTASFEVRTFEAPHYRRFLLQHLPELRQKSCTGWMDFFAFEDGDEATVSDVVRSAVSGPNGFVFISHAGEVRASEFLPLPAGNVRHRTLAAIYRDAPLFEELRAASNLKGKCGICEFKALCGGSRARSWSTTGDLFGADPLCAYRPGIPQAPRREILSQR
jgi:radical SAM protein with 4Fe4S-binding SPASM domain